MNKTNTIFDYLKGKEIEYINLFEYVRRGAGDVYYVRIEGDGLDDLGVSDGDLLIVDRERKPQAGSLVIFQVGDDVMIYPYRKPKAEIYLATSDGRKVVQSKHEPIAAPKGEYIVWATVTYIVRSVERREKSDAQN